MKHPITVLTPMDKNMKITKEMIPTTEEERQEMKNQRINQGTNLFG